MNRIANSSHSHKPRGSYVIDAIFKATSDACAISGNRLSLTDETAGGYYVQFTVSEPLFLSPFLLGLASKEDHSGIFSINALNFTINFSQSANRAWRSARFATPATATSATPTYQTKTTTLIYVTRTPRWSVSSTHRKRLCLTTLDAQSPTTSSKSSKHPHKTR